MLIQGLRRQRYSVEWYPAYCLQKYWIRCFSWLQLPMPAAWTPDFTDAEICLQGDTVFAVISAVSLHLSQSKIFLLRQSWNWKKPRRYRQRNKLRRTCFCERWPTHGQLSDSWPKSAAAQKSEYTSESEWQRKGSQNAKRKSMFFVISLRVQTVISFSSSPRNGLIMRKLWIKDLIVMASSSPWFWLNLRKMNGATISCNPPKAVSAAKWKSFQHHHLLLQWVSWWCLCFSPACTLSWR